MNKIICLLEGLDKNLVYKLEKIKYKQNSLIKVGHKTIGELNFAIFDLGESDLIILMSVHNAFDYLRTSEIIDVDTFDENSVTLESVNSFYKLSW